MTSDARMVALQRRVREDGLSIDDAAKEQEIDPIVAHLWLRLPEGFSEDTNKKKPGGGVEGQDGVGANGLRRVLGCRVVTAAIVQLRQTDGPLERAAEQALIRGLRGVEEADTRHEPAGGEPAVRYVEGQRPLAVSIPLPAYAAVLGVAERLFDSDPRAAAAWLIARGVGIPMAPPIKIAPETTSKGHVSPPRRSGAVGPHRSPRRAVARAEDVPAPSGDELRAMREALGIPQSAVAARTGLSRGTVAEVERGRRLNAATRQRIADTLVGERRSA